MNEAAEALLAATSEPVREKGFVLWFDNEKGYGFLQRQDGENVFVHQSSIKMKGYRTLSENQLVSFDVVVTPKRAKRNQRNSRITQVSRGKTQSPPKVARKNYEHRSKREELQRSD